MSNSTTIIDYLQRGTFASRPASPATPGAISASATAFYWATDTLVLYMWTGAAWAIVGSGTGGGPAPEWNTQDGLLGAFILGTDGRTIAGCSSGVGFASMRAGASHAAASGKFYFEFLHIAVNNHAPIVGVGTASASIAPNFFVGKDANGWGISSTTGLTWNNNVSNAENAYAAGDTVGVAVDFTAGTGSIKFFKNNAAQLFAYTGLTPGTLFPMVSMDGTGSSEYGRLCLKASEQTYPPPAGYIAWS